MTNGRVYWGKMHALMLNARDLVWSTMDPMQETTIQKPVTQTQVDEVTVKTSVMEHNRAVFDLVCPDLNLGGCHLMHVYGNM